MTIPIVCTLIMFSLKLIYQILFNKKSFTCTLLKDACEAFSRLPNHDLANKQLAYSLITKFIPNKSEMIFFEKNFLGCPYEIQEYAKYKAHISIKEPHRKLTFQNANLIYGLNLLFSIGVLFSMILFLYYYLKSSQYNPHSVECIKNIINAIAMSILLFICASSAQSSRKILSYWKKLAASLKDIDTSPFKISKIFQRTRRVNK